MQIKFGGFYFNNGLRIQLNPKNNPKNMDILMQLEMIKGKSGVLVIKNLVVDEETHPENLSVYFEDDNYLLMLLDYDDEGCIDVRTANNEHASKGEFQNILGEPYGATTIVQDFEIVKKCFIEFNQTGNVSRDLLN